MIADVGQLFATLVSPACDGEQRNFAAFFSFKRLSSARIGESPVGSLPEPHPASPAQEQNIKIKVRN